MTEREGERRDTHRAQSDAVTDDPVSDATDAVTDEPATVENSADVTGTDGSDVDATGTDGSGADGISLEEGRQEQGSSPADEVRRALRAARERRRELPQSRPLKHPQRQSPRTPSSRERTPEPSPGRQTEQETRRPGVGPSPESPGPRTDRTPGGSAASPAAAARAALRRTPSTPPAPLTSPAEPASAATEASTAADSPAPTPAAPQRIAPQHTASPYAAPQHTAPEADSPPATQAPQTPNDPLVPHDPHVPSGPRPGDIAREALRAARAQARRDPAGTGERAGRENERNAPRNRPRSRPERRFPADRLQGPVPDPVAGERARAVRDLLAGAFRMPTDGAADPDTDPDSETDTDFETDTNPEVPAPPGTWTATSTTSADVPRPVADTSASPRATDGNPPVRAAETSAPALAAAASADTSGTRASAAPHGTDPAGTSPTVYSPAVPPSPRSMAAPSRDGDHRRTFPPFPPRTGGSFAETWWGNAWVAALEEGALDVKRLVRGRGYAEQGNVDAITVTPGLVLAYVQGSRPRPYRVQVRLRTLGGEDWERFLDAAVERPGHIAALLDKEMPESLAAFGVPLLPGPGDLEPQCSCPDRGHPCKHAAALCYQTARLLDADPFVLLLLRGRGEREVLDALSRRNAVRAARAAQEQEQQPEPLAGVRAAEALAERRLPPLPAPLAVPPHPEQPPAYPSAPHGPDSFALDHLATDAAARAHALLTTGHDDIGALTLWQDAVRLAASRPGSGLTAATRSLYASLASAAGRTPSELARAVAAWRQGGPDGLTVLEETWDPPAGRFDRARPLLLAADLPAFRPRRNHLTHPRGHVQLRYGQDGLWYAYESEPGQDDWWPRGTPDPDPVGALTGLGGSDEL
ncbi:SWIM zinc finger family protein [Streptomyces hayashii]